MADEFVPVKFECKEVAPCENSRTVHISPHNSGTVIDSETDASARSISRHMAPVDAQNLAIPGAIPQNGRIPV